MDANMLLTDGSDLLAPAREVFSIGGELIDTSGLSDEQLDLLRDAVATVEEQRVADIFPQAFGMQGLSHSSDIGHFNPKSLSAILWDTPFGRPLPLRPTGSGHQSRNSPGTKARRQWKRRQRSGAGRR